MSPGQRESAPVRSLFVLLLLVVFVPSRLMALAHGANIPRLVGASISALLVSWLLYRLCARSGRQDWLVALSIPAVYIAVFGAPMYALGVLFALYAARGVARRFGVGSSSPHEPPVTPPAAGPGLPPLLDQTTSPSVQIVDLSEISRPYRWFLFSQRMVRAAVASLAGSALFAGRALLFFGVVDFRNPTLGVIGGVGLTMFLGLASAVMFWWLWGLWRGSMTAAYVRTVGDE